MSKKKQIQKKIQNKNNEQIVSGNELTNLIKIVVIVCVVLLVFYFITVLVNKKEDNNNYTEDTTATIQYSKILVGQILNRTDSEYYVLVEEKNDQYVSLYNYYLSLYSEKSSSLKYYNVDLSDIFNQNHIGDKNITAGNISDFKFSGTVLLKIKDAQVLEMYEDREKIVSYLEQLVK